MCDVSKPELDNLDDKWQQELNEWREEGEDLGDSGHVCLPLLKRRCRDRTRHQLTNG